MRAVIAIIVFFCVITSTNSEIDKDFKHTNIVFIGATGDLATKYLWRSLFEFFGRHYEQKKHVFQIYACSRKSPDAGREFVSDVLLKVITCPQDDADCRKIKMKFVEAVQYHQLKKEKHYETLASKMNENVQSMYGLQGSPLSPEDGRLIYLSIPPSSYLKIVKMVDGYLRPVIGRPWFRVVIEKPFGRDYDSAAELMSKLSDHLVESEIYLTDHYLAKTVVREILPFRYLNREIYERLWNREHIERVEVVMKERLDVQGRMKFYDEFGVIRDVMQNHLTMMASLIGMDLPKNSGVIRDILNSRTSFLRQVEPINKRSVLIGQYSSYASQFLEEIGRAANATNTATFAASVMSLNSPRWRGVPFVLVSGKRLDKKISYIRIVFKDNVFRLRHERSNNCSPAQIVFHISSGNHLELDMITVSKKLLKPVASAQWSQRQTTGTRFFFGESINATYQLIPNVIDEAYTLLLDAVYLGQRHFFIDQQSMLASWKIWDDVLKDLQTKVPRTYEGHGADEEQLDFEIMADGSVNYIHQDVMTEMDDSELTRFSVPEMIQIPATFRDSKLVTGNTDEVLAKLMDDMENVAQRAITDRGSFHLALPGGQTPIRLFQHFLSHRSNFPWLHTHLWQVDERCVPHDHPDSNFRSIDTNLIQHIPIPYLNVHPMPIDLSDEPCSQNDAGDRIYESKIRRFTINSTMDFVLLGIGSDGHVASLFPNQMSLNDSNHFVIYSAAGKDQTVRRRMTFTFSLLNHARSIAVLVLGRSKHKIIEDLAKHDDACMWQYPVLGLKPSNQSELIWYIDGEALFGK